MINNIYNKYIYGDFMRKILVNITDEQYEHICEKKKRFGMSYVSQIQSLLRQDIERYETSQSFSPSNIQIYNQSVVSPIVRKNKKEVSQRVEINKEILPILERRRKMCEVVE